MIHQFLFEKTIIKEPSNLNNQCDKESKELV